MTDIHLLFFSNELEEVEEELRLNAQELRNTNDLLDKILSDNHRLQLKYEGAVYKYRKYREGGVNLRKSFQLSAGSPGVRTHGF